MSSTLLNLTRLSQIAKSGTSQDVDILMDMLDTADSIGGYKMLDYAIGQVESQEGRTQIRYYLFNGSQVQRNYASLYFKRLGFHDILLEAVQQGCIDAHQALSR